MTKLLTSTAVGLIAAFAIPAQAQDSSSQTAQMDDPCSAQWVAVDENSDGKISESEAQKATEAQFSQIDRDGDGMISVKNWKDCTVPSAIPGGFQSAEGTGTDRTPPGALTEGETAGAQATEEGTSEQAQANGETGQQATESTRALQAPSGGAETPADWGDEQFGEMDTDYSGYITSEEAGEWTQNRVTGTVDEEETLGRYGAMFSMMDEDADGRITQQEWDAREQMDVQSRFGRIDQDGDDQISQSEWGDYRQQRFGEAQQDMQQQGQQQGQQEAQQQGQTQQQGQQQEQAQAAAGEEPTLWLYYFRSL